MAISKKGILGGISGSIGPVVGVVSGKKNILKSKPKKTKKSKNKVNHQKVRLPLVSAFLSLFIEPINLGYAEKRSTMSSFNRAVKYNVDNAVAGIHPNFELDYSKIMFSKGNLEPVWSGRMAAEESSIKFSWEIPASVKLKLVAKDSAYILVYNSTKQRKQIWSAIADRDQLSIVKPSLGKAGDVFYGWMFFISADGKSVSNSVYLGSITALV